MATDSPSPHGAYEIAPLFPIRMAGVPFDVLAPLATPRALALAREVAAQAAEVDRRAAAAQEALLREADGPGRRIRDHLGRLIAKRQAPEALSAGAPPEVGAYAEAVARLGRLRARHDEVLRDELDAGFRALRRAAVRFMPEYALFASSTVEALAADLRPDGEWTPERRRNQRRDRTLLMYVQRLATKNETMSAYGPLAWGRVDAAGRGVRLEAREGVLRQAYFERWVADAIVATMNRDPETRAEIAPRLHPFARLEDGAVLRLDTGARVPLDAETLALVARCDGRTPAQVLGAGDRLAALADEGALLWTMECPAFVLDRIGALRASVAAWRDGPARARWAPVLAALSAIPEAFLRETDAASRREIVARAREIVEGLGAERTPAAAERQRDLYRGSNVLGEECVRDAELVVGADLARQVAAGAAPWFDLWRDVYAFCAHRANEKLRALHATVPGRSGAVPLPAFLRASDAAGLPLTGIGIPALAHVAFGEARAAFREAMAGRKDARVWTLAAEDCAFLGRRFDFPRFDAFTFPSADLQLAAGSAADVAAGRHRWVVAELHLAAAVLVQSIVWSSPDREAFGRSVRSVAGRTCDWGFPTDLVSHTMLDFEPLAGLWTYLGPSAVAARWIAVRPADAEVVVADDGDVRVRAAGVDRGSFARSWVLGLGFHPFVLPTGAHTPRLELGGVVVQRESWVVSAVDLPSAPYRSGAPELARDVERLRAARGVPRYVFVRPTEAAVRRIGAGGRDKDVKPVFVDLESYAFLDVLARWLAKHGELDVTEMLPGPDDLLWREADGRRTFELRTLVGPAR